MRFRLYYLPIIISLLFSVTSYAAFPVKSFATIISSELPTEHREHVSSTGNFIRRLYNKGHHLFVPMHVGGHRGVAILFGILGLLPFSLFFMGTHRLYYRYWLIGALQFLGFLSLITGLFFITLGSVYFLNLYIPLFVFGGLMYLWHFVDLVRIIQNNLLPKGERPIAGDHRHYR